MKMRKQVYGKDWDKLLSSLERTFMHSRVLDTEFLQLHDLPLGHHYDSLKLQNHPFLNTVNQIQLANITEWIRSSHQLHRGLINSCVRNRDNGQMLRKNKGHGNKMAILSGAWTLSRAYHYLANLNNSVVSFLMSSAIRDFVEGEFFGLYDGYNNPLPPRFNLIRRTEQQPVLCVQTAAVQDWNHRNTLLGATLLGYGCKGTVLLAGYEPKFQYHAYEFGKHFALAFKASSDFDLFVSFSDKILDLTIAPVMLHLEYDSTLYVEIEKGYENTGNIDFIKIQTDVSRGPGPILTQQLVRYHTEKAIQHLQIFPQNEAYQILYDITAELNQFHN